VDRRFEFSIAFASSFLIYLIYMTMPNTRVPFKPALGGGII
jgi:hypothetical protein